MLTFGEGWHNNHHAHPVSARHGLAWYEFDFNWLGIRTLQALGLAWDVKAANARTRPPHAAADQRRRGYHGRRTRARRLAGSVDWSGGFAG